MTVNQGYEDDDAQLAYEDDDRGRRPGATCKCGHPLADGRCDGCGESPTMCDCEGRDPPEPPIEADAPTSRLECVKCGSRTGPAHPIDADHAGWLCPACYATIEEDELDDGPNLKACPFCGSEATYREDGSGGEFIECGGCRASSPMMRPEKCNVRGLLAERWNARAGGDVLRRLRDAVVASLDMDAVGPGLGEAVNVASDILDGED